MSRIKIIQPNESEGRLKEIYTQLEQQRGQMPKSIKYKA